MNIRKIVLADDETIQRNVLNQIIARLSPQTHVTLCSNGQEAWEAVCQETPEVLITDIRMPVMDGMELIQRVSARFPDVCLILISAYSEFEYAQKAISCRVSEYLLKPFRVQDVSDILQKAEKEVLEKQAISSRNSLYETMLAQSRQQARQKLLSALLDGRQRADALDSDIAARLNCDGFVCLIRWKLRLPGAGGPKQPPGPGILSDRQQELLTGYIHALFPEQLFVFLNPGLDLSECRLALILSGISPGEFREKLRLLEQDCRREGLVFHAGISGPFSPLSSSLCIACRQAEELLSFSFYRPETIGIFSRKEFLLPQEPSLPSLSSCEGRLRTAVHNADEHAVAAVLDELKGLLTKAPYPPARVRHRISSMIVSILRDLDGMIAPEEYDSLLNGAYQLYGSCDSLDSLLSISASLLQQTLARIAQESGQLDMAEDVISYIKKHLQEELSLQQLADRVHFSANYLSAQIKKKTGMSYVNYLTALRTEKACRLLTDTDRKVWEIAEQCGYKDSSYFNRIFCRRYGLSPEQYRKAHKKC